MTTVAHRPATPYWQNRPIVAQMGCEVSDGVREQARWLALALSAGLVDTQEHDAGCGCAGRHRRSDARVLLGPVATRRGHQPDAYQSAPDRGWYGRPKERYEMGQLRRLSARRSLGFDVTIPH
jgi:hypothetical protein